MVREGIGDGESPTTGNETGARKRRPDTPTPFSASQGEKESYNGLGIIHRDGLGVPVDLVKAQEYFQAAADQDLAEAHVNLGKLALGASPSPWLVSLPGTSS